MARQGWVGTSDRLGSNNTPNLSAAFTLFAWIRPDSIHGGTAGIVDRWDGGSTSSAYAITVESGNKIQGYINNGSTTKTVEASTPVPPFKWSSVAYTHRDTSSVDQIWINGKSNASAVPGINAANNGGVLEVFNAALATLRLSGSLQDVALWAIDLNQSELDQLHHGMKPISIRRGALKGWWPLLEDGSASSLDYSGNGITLAVNSGTFRLVDGPCFIAGGVLS